MPSADLLVTVAEYAVTALLLIRMTVVGFLQPPGRTFSWPMFTRGCEIDIAFEVETDHGREQVDLFGLLPAHHPAISTEDLQIVVDYLAQTKGSVTGQGIVLHAAGKDIVKVEAGRVVV
ncbi:hypothetical protein [Kutzneria sp. NPDC052558]|uniref:hypothetical protein n=1 Tax=Kutzneria sp. NPDC052558 TaxID=3364121 RepID=UPI0037CB7A97